jgi:hypothetical protein
MNHKPTSPGLIPLHGGYRRLKSLQIDALVNDLYALTPAEIKIVEGK